MIVCKNCVVDSYVVAKEFSEFLMICINSGKSKYIIESIMLKIFKNKIIQNNNSSSIGMKITLICVEVCRVRSR